MRCLQGCVRAVFVEGFLKEQASRCVMFQQDAVCDGSSHLVNIKPNISEAVSGSVSLMV